MTDLDPKILIGIGFPLLVLGFVLPMLMTMQIIPSTFFLNFFSYGASLLGLILGMLGAMSIIVRNRNRRR
jgi:uncharacterized membrane protein YedE/YeeE